MQNNGKTLAIAMWDFSWLERRGSGEGFEDWDKAVRELVERGYDAVRIDPYPHLIDIDRNGSFLLEPVWTECSWGATVPITVNGVLDKLLAFMAVCRKYGVLVGLSGWYRGSRKDPYTGNIKTAEEFAAIWVHLTDEIRSAGLLESVLYIDFINEFPNWGGLSPRREDGSMLPRDDEQTKIWAGDCIRVFKNSYPDIPVTFSISSEFYRMEREDYTNWDFLEPHIWANSDGDGRFDTIIDREKRVPEGSDYLVGMNEAKKLYESTPKYWHRVLQQQIDYFADIARERHLPLMTTECWAVVFYRESGPGWEWIRELCEAGVEAAVASGCWWAIGTSNFCAPQFEGMWADVEWHKRMTDRIHSGFYSV